MAITFDEIFERAVKEGRVLNENGKAIDWLRKTATQLTKIDPNKMLLETKTVGSIQSKANIGRLFIFKYNAKTKQDLPYWDKYPVVFLLDLKKDGFLALNMHYLPPKQRALLMDNLYKISNNANFDDTTKLQITYALLKKTQKLRLFKPTLKRYLKDFVMSQYIYVPPMHWELCLFLPLARWQKASEQKVWDDSLRIARKK